MLGTATSAVDLSSDVQISGFNSFIRPNFSLFSLMALADHGVGLKGRPWRLESLRSPRAQKRCSSQAYEVSDSFGRSCDGSIPCDSCFRPTCKGFLNIDTTVLPRGSLTVTDWYILSNANHLAGSFCPVSGLHQLRAPCVTMSFSLFKQKGARTPEEIARHTRGALLAWAEHHEQSSEPEVKASREKVRGHEVVGWWQHCTQPVGQHCV